MRLLVSIGLTLLILSTSVRVVPTTLIGVMGVCWPIILCTEFTVFLYLLAASYTMIRAHALIIWFALFRLVGKGYSAGDSSVVP